MNQHSVIRILSLLLIGVVSSACGDPYVEAVGQTQIAPNGNAACGSITESTWAVGTEMDIQLVGENGGTQFSLGPKLPLPNWTNEFAPTNAHVESSDSTVWEVVSGPDADNVVHLRAAKAGSAQLTITADGTQPSTITLRSADVATLQLSINGTPVSDHVNVEAGGRFSLTVRALDENHQTLCASGGSLHRRNISYSDPSNIPTDLMNEEWLLDVPHHAGDEPLDATFGMAETVVTVVVINPSQITSFTSDLVTTPTDEETINLHAYAGSEEVLSVDYTVTSLDPQLASADYNAHDAQATLFGIYDSTTGQYLHGTAHFDLSVTGSSLAHEAIEWSIRQ